jgi:hypothetical protein
MGRRLALRVVLSLGAASVAAQQPSLDYTQWRGRDRDGSASAFVAPAWLEKLTLKWKTEVGAGYGTPLVVGPVVYATWAQPAISGNRFSIKDAASVALWALETAGGGRP